MNIKRFAFSCFEVAVIAVLLGSIYGAFPDDVAELPHVPITIIDGEGGYLKISNLTIYGAVVIRNFESMWASNIWVHWPHGAAYDCRSAGVIVRSGFRAGNVTQDGNSAKILGDFGVGTWTIDGDGPYVFSWKGVMEISGPIEFDADSHWMLHGQK